MADGYGWMFTADTTTHLPAYDGPTVRLLDAAGWTPAQGSALLPRAGRKPTSVFAPTINTGPDSTTCPPCSGVIVDATGAPATGYRFVIPGAVTKAFAARPASGNSRQDLIVARVYDASMHGSTTLREVDVEIKTGTASANPSTPTSDDGTVVLYVATVPASGSITITRLGPRTVASGGVIPVVDATDLGTLNVYDGAIAYREDTDVYLGRINGSWVQIAAADSGWIALPYAANYQDYGSGYQGAQYRKIGNQVFLRGLVTRNTSTAAGGSVLATLPAGFRPASSHMFAVDNSDAFGRVDINNVGGIVHAQALTTGGGFVSLNGLSFFVD